MSDTDLPFGFLLYDAARLYRRNIDRRAKALDLTRAQWQVLLYLSRCEGSHQAAIAEMLEIEPITLVRLLDRLEEAGWVERRSDPKDRRTRRLFLKEGARSILERMQILGKETRDLALGGFTEAEAHQLMSLLTRIRINLSERDNSNEALKKNEAMKKKVVSHG